MQHNLKNIAHGLRRFGHALATVGGLMAAGTAAEAQSSFSPAIVVNGDIITQFEVDQRALFMAVLRAPGNADELARRDLIDDALKWQAIREAGFAIAPEEVELAMEEFAARVNLSTDEFVSAIGEAGVERQTFRDFAAIGIAWREYVNARFLAQARPSQEEVDRALGRGGQSGVRVLLSEIVIPVTPENLAQAEELASQLSQIRSIDAFSAEAGRYSATETRSRGGRMDWISLSELPPGLQPVILALTPGEVTEPLNLQNAIALFQLRDIREASVPAPRYSAIDYAMYYIAGGRSAEALEQAAALRQRVDVCDDLYGIAKDQPESVLDRQSQAPSEIPNDVAIELAKLDPGETSTVLTRNNGQTLVFLMLCGRTTEINEEATRAEVAAALTQQRISALSAGFVQQLRASAIIEER